MWKPFRSEQISSMSLPQYDSKRDMRACVRAVQVHCKLERVGKFPRQVAPTRLYTAKN